MHKAPIGRIETIQQALGPDLRNLPFPEHSEQIDFALSRAVQDVTELTRDGGDKEQVSGGRRKRGH